MTEIFNKTKRHEKNHDGVSSLNELRRKNGFLRFAIDPY